MIYEFDSIHFYSISETVFEIFQKNCFEKKNFVRCYGYLRRLDLGQITLFFVVVFFRCFFLLLLGI